MDAPGESPYPAFAEASAVCPPRELKVRIGDTLVLVRVTGKQLARRLFDPIRHIEAEPSAPPADFTICAWSVAETGVAEPGGVTWGKDVPLEWIAPGGQLIVSCLPGAETLQRVSIARPFQWSLVPLLAARGLYATHAGLIALPDGGPGLMLVGPNVSGKSTTCLSAVESGFKMVGEDFIAVERTGSGFTGRSLYASSNVTRFTQQLYPALSAHLQLPYDASPDGKAILVFTPDVSPNPMLRSTSISAVVFPVITGDNGTEVQPIPKGEALRRFVPALRQAKKLPLAGRLAHHDALIPLVAELPTFRLNLGRDVENIPRCLVQLSSMLE